MTRLAQIMSPNAITSPTIVANYLLDVGDNE